MPPEAQTACFESGRSIIWIASYPKSGNTWLRSLLTAFLYPDEPLDINALIAAPAQLSRQMLDDEAGINSGEMPTHALEPYRGDLHIKLAQDAAAQGMVPCFLKTHDAFSPRLFPAEASAGAIYIVRDPIDIVPSLAHHEGRDFGWTIKRLADPDATLNRWPDRSSPGVPECMSSWSGNIASWTGQDHVPTLLLRYEDMHAEPEHILAKVLTFCAVPFEPATITNAVAACTIGRLQAQENTSGFREKPSQGRSFFRSGTIGDGRRKLSLAQQQEITACHSHQMTKHGYAATD